MDDTEWPIWLPSEATHPERLPEGSKPRPLSPPYVLTIPSKLPPEIISNILAHLAEDAIYSLHGESTDPDNIDPQFKLPIDPSSFPEPICNELNRLLRQRWLRCEKTLRDPWEFCALHIICLARKESFDIPHNLLLLAISTQTIELPYVMKPHPNLPYHGLERIRLDFTSEDYFALFGVKVPPFENENISIGHADAYGAATFLKHTKELTLHFGSLYRSAHPWYELSDTAWDVPDHSGVEPRLRPGVCVSGLVVDWILAYAWQHQLLQHIPSIALSGDVQAWVKAKWELIFKRAHPQQEDYGNGKEVDAIEQVGRRESIMQGTDWEPQDHYPPVCRCEVNCDRLGVSGVLDEVGVGNGNWSSSDCVPEKGNGLSWNENTVSSGNEGTSGDGGF